MPPIEATPATPAGTQEQPPAAELSLAEQLGINPDANHAPDSDEARMLSALSEVEAEGAAGADTAPAAQQPDQTQQQPDQTQQQQPSHTVPVAAVAEARRKQRETELELARVQGQNELLTSLVMRGAITPQHASAVQEGRAELDPQHQVNHYADIDAKEDTLAKRYEDGEITHVQWVQEDRKLKAERRRVDQQVERTQRQERAIEQSRPAAQQIEETFPSLGKMSQAQMDACGPLARANTERVLASRGIGEFDSANPEHLRIFHFHVAYLADQNFNGGRDFAAFQASRTQGAQPNGQQPTGRQPNGSNTKPSPSRTPVPGRVTDPTQLIRDKVQLSQRHPPDVTGMNDRGNTVPTQLEQQVVNMTTEDVARMDPALRNQMLGIS
jgi:hypothetical protein